MLLHRIKKEGRFIFELPSGSYSFFVTYVGYNSKRTTVIVPDEKEIVIALHAAAIQMPEVTINSNAEDPAVEIIREAIKRREKNYEGLKNYDVKAYKKDILYAGNRIAMIDEKFVKQIYEKGKMNKEFILSTYKTENIKKQPMPINMNIGLSLFFVNGDLNFKVGRSKSSLVFPLADNAFDYYNFKLLNSKAAGNEISHTIQVIPRSSVEPLLKGKIIIDDATYALIGADVESNEGWSIPLVKNFFMKIQQAYAQYNGFWIPQYSEFEIGGELSALGGMISMEPMEVSEMFSASTCTVNGIIPDSIKNARHSVYGGYTTDTTKPASKLRRYWKTKTPPNPATLAYEPKTAPPEISAAAMDSLRPLPLTASESIAFAQLDSTQTLEKIFQPKGALGAAGFSSSSSDTTRSFFGTVTSALWKYGILHNNRVEGISPGAYFDSDEMESDFFYNAAASYATGAKQFEWDIGGGYNVGDDHWDRIDLNVWNTIRPWQASHCITKTINSVGFTSTGTDYFNYLKSTGFNIGIDKYFTDVLFLKIYATAERQRSIPENSFIALKKDRRTNPAIAEGNDNALLFQFGYMPYGVLPFPLQSTNLIFVSGKVSHPALGSDFNYRQLSFYGNLRFRSLYSTMFIAPYFFFAAEGGIVSGKYGVQHLFTAPSAFSFYSPVGTLKGIQPYDVVGQKYFAVQGEHNWQWLPLAFLGKKWSEESGIQIITGGSIANVWNSGSYFTAQNKWKPYWEAYIGVANIVSLFRIDAVHTSKKTNVIRLSFSSAVLN
ncbi:MAG: hypothetical protein KGJ59_05245 [Bacteroidota bacterium]|nr:hypothetical protein [Bacteroidota bacterium]